MSTNNWTLFLDRDGVINKRIIAGYVTVPNQFELLPNVLAALKSFNKIFNKIIVVTNQQGIAKGLYTHKDLALVHNYMLQLFKENDIFIDGVYYAPNLALENSELRKPAIGMALEAQKDFPDIVFSQSVMIGDSKSDMQFGKNIGAKTIWLGNTEIENTLYDVACKDLYSASLLINQLL